jgi:hypothetical protein
MRIMTFRAGRIGLPLAAGILILIFNTPAASQTFGAIGERAQGMAGAFVAVADDASAVYWNPAGLAWPTGSLFDAQVGIGKDTAFVGMALPPLGLSYYRLPIVPTPEGRKKEGSGKVAIRTFATTNVGATVNQTLVNRVVIGTTLRLLHGGFDAEPSRTTLDVDMGAMVSFGDVRAGLTARNLARPVFQRTSGPFPLSRQVRAGLAFAPRSLSTGGLHGPFSVAFDADLSKTQQIDGSDARQAAIGAEYWLRKGQVGLRGGLNWSTLHDEDPAIAWGFTVRLPRSLFVEGHLTNNRQRDQREWGAGARFTF